MFEITADTAADYLRSAGRLAAGDAPQVRELPGGVSNVVLLITLPASGERFVLKQARGQLRVKEEWLCPIERIWREVETLRTCSELLAAQAATRPPPQTGFLAAFEPTLPALLWEDRDNYCYAMTAAPPGHRTWKELLLAGEWTTGIGLATACGQLLARLHGRSWEDAAIAARLDDRTYFDMLRLDPYYRHAAKVRPELAQPLQALIDSVWSHRRCLVHGDFSPKNLLVWQGRVMLIDFEVGHFGDPAFDLGFFLTHLLLKCIWAGPHRHQQYWGPVAAFWNTYRNELAAAVAHNELIELENRMVLNLAGCLLARVDGKSPVDYLDPDQQQDARKLSHALFAEPTKTFESVHRALLALC